MRKTVPVLILIVLPVLGLGACSRAVDLEGDYPMTMELTSSAFENGGRIPDQFTCEGEDVSPPLEWSGVPETRTESLALIVDDPDAPGKTWVHWVLYNLPPDTPRLEKGSPGGAEVGRNDFKDASYGGPCPPSGDPHTYHFKLYALDTTLDLEAGATKKDVELAMQDHILDMAELTGTYSR